MKQPSNEPKPDFGFYAAIPRMVRTGYKDLTAAQKWLYVCLKDLCGDHGTCYRSLRTLSEETGISTGMLSESIRDLHDARLIHAEKKKRTEGGKEVWHITVTDIWIANGKLHPSKRSHTEQTSEERSQNANPPSSQRENVHSVNENVQTANDKGRKRSAGERERSFCETEERTKKQEHSEVRREKETPAISPTSPSPAQSSLSPSSVQKNSLLESLSDEQADFWRRWCAISHCGDDALKEQLLPDITWLAERIHTTADLESLYRSNAAMLLELSQAKSTQYTPPHLKNLVKHYPTWASAQDAKQKQREQASQKQVPGTGAVKNWTQARLSGQMDAPPVVYPDAEKPKKPASLTESMGIKKDLAAMLEKMRG